jgi:hypothetical protein
MPKVMPTVLARVEGRISMPEHMAEQMRDLMPRRASPIVAHGEINL